MGARGDRLEDALPLAGTRYVPDSGRAHHRRISRVVDTFAAPFRRAIGHHMCTVRLTQTSGASKDAARRDAFAKPARIVVRCLVTEQCRSPRLATSTNCSPLGTHIGGADRVENTAGERARARRTLSVTTNYYYKHNNIIEYCNKYVLSSRQAVLFVSSDLVALKRAVCHRCRLRVGVSGRCLTAETVQGAALTLERVDDVHGGDRLPLGVLGVGDCIADHVL